MVETHSVFIFFAVAGFFVVIEQKTTTTWCTGRSVGRPMHNSHPAILDSNCTAQEANEQLQTILVRARNKRLRFDVVTVHFNTDSLPTIFYPSTESTILCWLMMMVVGCVRPSWSVWVSVCLWHGWLARMHIHIYK